MRRVEGEEGVVEIGSFGVVELWSCGVVNMELTVMVIETL